MLPRNIGMSKLPNPLQKAQFPHARWAEGILAFASHKEPSVAASHPVLRQPCDDLPDLRLKAHVEHPVLRRRE